MADQLTESVPVMQDEAVTKAKEFVELWMRESPKLLSIDLEQFTLASIISFMHNGMRSNLQKVPDLGKIIKENKDKREELKKKQDSLREKLKRIGTDVSFIEDDAKEAETKAISKCMEIDRKIQAQKTEYEVKLREENRKQLDEVKNRTEHLRRRLKYEQMKIIEQYQAQITAEEKEWQKLVEISESNKNWRSLDEFTIKKQPTIIEKPIKDQNYTKLELIVTEYEEIIDERKITAHEKELTLQVPIPIQALVKYISVKSKLTNQLVATICINISELSSLKLAGFRKIATELPTEAKFLFKGAPVTLKQEELYKLVQVLDGDNIWIKVAN